MRERPETEALRGLSEELRRFVGEMPWERSRSWRTRGVRRPRHPGALVLDVGAGDAPYRELFHHAEYRSSDWEASPHEGARAPTSSARLELPLADAEIDVVLCTQVLEHVSEPAATLRRSPACCAPGGRLYLTVPLVWELHELPHDYFRFTGPGLEHLLRRAGFAGAVVEPRTDCFTTAAQLLANLGRAMGRAPDGMDARRDEVSALLASLPSKSPRSHRSTCSGSSRSAIKQWP